MVQGVPTDDQEAIKDLAISFFSKLFAKDSKERPIIDKLFHKSLKQEVVDGLEVRFFERCNFFYG